MHSNKLKWSKDTWVSKLYFFYYDDYSGYQRPAVETTCHIGKILLASLLVLCFSHRIKGTRVRPWMFLGVALYALSAIFLTDFTRFATTLALGIGTIFLIWGVLAFGVFLLVDVRNHQRSKKLLRSHSAGSPTILKKLIYSIKNKVCFPVDWV